MNRKRYLFGALLAVGALAFVVSSPHFADVHAEKAFTVSLSTVTGPPPDVLDAMLLIYPVAVETFQTALAPAPDPLPGKKGGAVPLPGKKLMQVVYMTPPLKPGRII